MHVMCNKCVLFGYILCYIHTLVVLVFELSSLYPRDYFTRLKGNKILFIVVLLFAYLLFSFQKSHFHSSCFYCLHLIQVIEEKMLKNKHMI